MRRVVMKTHQSGSAVYKRRPNVRLGGLMIACAIAFGCCLPALAADNHAVPKAANPNGAKSKTFPNFTISMDAAIEIGGVYAAYVTVTNIASNADPLGVTKVVMQWPRAITFKGERVNRLDAPAAMALAGGGDKLLAALGDRGSVLKQPVQNRVASDVLAAPVLPILAPGLLVAGPAALIYRSMQGHEYRVRLAVDAKEFQLSPTRLDPFGTRLLTFAEPPLDGLLPEWSEQGYIFYPLGDYVTLEMAGQELHNNETEGGPLETVSCPWE
jgi:hypothetical protein